MWFDGCSDQSKRWFDSISLKIKHFLNQYSLEPTFSFLPMVSSIQIRLDQMMIYHIMIADEAHEWFHFNLMGIHPRKRNLLDLIHSSFARTMSVSCLLVVHLRHLLYMCIHYSIVFHRMTQPIIAKYTKLLLISRRSDMLLQYVSAVGSSRWKENFKRLFKVKKKNPSKIWFSLVDVTTIDTKI